MLLEKDKMLSNKRMSLQFSINIPDQLQTRPVSSVGSEILQCHQGMKQLTSLLKNLPFTEVQRQ